ncbi:hypothetical protein [Alkalihalobacillus sp. AL-G]|uniref:hypothetical protein n=1 Tax=Alkalihalobacillus sp. AL-G TaxID=2926399 RepID=UPI00272A07A5|nr:hypothetical protein [Alkalihalobacillus sp. AL-G]WLD93856.1 hypothetical protein MOJ78_02765 [Alkalihalobacillus sp. AL-G]
MVIFLIWFLLMIAGGIGGIGICSMLEGNEVFSGYAAMLGMVVALLSGIFFQLILMHQKAQAKENS